ncbi:hypothetical protein [Mycobacterium sp.]|uniref:hypothetical protein n=1 Tax=Mycobacterium sp. TaxID=1785 RepID=UPI0031E3AD9B
MTTPSYLWGDGWDSPPRRLYRRDQVLSRRQARRMSRRFAGVGVGIAAVRLQELAAGAPVAGDELADVNFAVVASEMQRAERLARFQRNRRRCVEYLLVAGLVLASLNLLFCLAYLFVSLALHDAPF